MKLYVEKSAWAGRRAPGTPPERKIDDLEFELKKGKENILEQHTYSTVNGKGVYKLYFTIIDIQEDCVTIKTSKPMSEGEDGIFLASKQTEFKIVKDKKTVIKTLSMDAGTIYVFTLK